MDASATALPDEIVSGVPHTAKHSAVPELPPADSAPPYHLRQQILSPLETLAQSISTIAPSTSPSLTIPAVFALAGEGTWLAYLLALVSMVLMAFCISVFARDSASPGSLYTYTRKTLPPWCSVLAGWALFFAYVTTASSVTAGFINYAYVILGKYGAHVPLALLDGLAIAGAVWIAHRDVKLSTRAMLWIEGISACLIAFVVALVMWKHGLHFDMPQLRLHGVTMSGVRLGMVLAIFSFVGFESATALGAEARDPLKTIPSAVIRSTLLAGTFFLICVYGEVLGFRSGTADLGQSTAPMQYLADRAGIGFIGRIINWGVVVSMFACTLGCIIAASRVLMLMAHHGLAHVRLGRTHAVRQTPVGAGLVAGVLSFLPVALLGWRGTTPADIYAYMGTLSVYGFLTIYALVAIAMPVHLLRRGMLTAGKVLLAASATAVVLFALIGSVYPVPPAPIRYLPYLYLVYIAAGMLWYAAARHRFGFVSR